MRLHILGIGGTFMSGVAILAKHLGHQVTGSDLSIYPPISTQLEEQHIQVLEGYEPSHIDPSTDCVIVGNVIKRGNAAMEYVLAKRIPYVSGPEWLANHILQDRWVLGVAGTHGKTTTASLVAFILDNIGLNPGFLIGGIPQNFGISARFGDQPYFVIEADEYDSAFFDKRSKFIHYRPKTAILNNLEFDHADIFPDLNAIKLQFHYLIRTIPGNGLIIAHAGDKNLDDVLKMGCWTNITTFGKGSGDWQANLLNNDGSQFKVLYKGDEVGEVHWELIGSHNVENALAALAAVCSLGVAPDRAIAVLPQFRSVRRRLEVKGKVKDILIYDDFAHHPTAIASTLAGLRAKIGQNKRIIAVIEFGSYTMRSGSHKERLPTIFKDADMVVCKSTEKEWGLNTLFAEKIAPPVSVYRDVDTIVDHLVPQLKQGDSIVIMSNSVFGGIHQKLMERLERG